MASNSPYVDAIIDSQVGESRVPDTTESHCTSPSLPAEPSLRITPDEAHAEYIVNLMTVYRYQVASWLDIIDTDQTFGVTVLMLATKTKPIRCEILKLAEIVQKKERTALSQSNATESINPKSSMEAAPFAISRVFRLLEEVTLDLTHFWDSEGESQNGGYVVETLLPHLNDGSPIIEAAYWLAIRLVLSCTLISRTPIRLPLLERARDRPIPATKREISLFAERAITLCLDAAMFSQEDNCQWLQQQYGLNRAEIWKVLIHAFGIWFKQRPEGLQPIIELYAKDGVHTHNDFPVIAFTSGAALLANQLYHTGMLLLLQNRPRFGNSHSSNSNSMSILWHVHRICGIAIQNDGPTTWDPSLIASLIIAARTLTHRSQQMAIVSTLETAQQLTGWNVTAHIEDLKSEWRSADGW